ncbi:MAG TPA: ABC transporter permease [Actinomycetes bacterium]|nr:ABC transporter permease [Actinomycetes bacterium]
MRLRYLARKLGWAVVTLFFVLTFNFFLFRVMPGDPAALLARSQRLTADEIAQQRALFGLDDPLLVQYWNYLKETLTGHLGSSYLSGRPVLETIGIYMWPTILLVGVGTGLAVIFGVLFGIKGAWQRGSGFDKTSLYGSLTLYSTPEGWLGMLLLIIFAGTLGWFPVNGYESNDQTGLAHIADVANHLVLPAMTLALGYGASFMLVMRSSLLEIKDEDFVGVARAKGLTETMVRRRHAVPNAFLPTFTLIVLSFGFVIGGAIVVETVFSWPGIGLLTYRAIEAYDFPVLQGVFLVSSIAVVVANLAADIAYGFLDPRIQEV